MKINGSFFKNLNTNVGTGKFKLFKTKKSAVITSVSLLLATTLGIGGILVGCGKQDDKVADLTQSDVVVTSPVDEEKEPEDEFSLLADRLSIKNLTMTDRLSAKIEAEVQAQLEALTPEGQTVYNPGDVHFADDGSAWVSEDDYKDYIEQGEKVTVESGYLAPDGNVWASEADYLAYINGQHESTVIVEGDFYTAPDGTIWTSEAEYKAYVESNNGTVEVPVNDGEFVEYGEGYRAPDGSYWTSEAEYKEYIKGQKEGTAVDTTKPEEETGKGETVVEGNFYTAPDGSVWSSKADYEEYMESLKGSSVQNNRRETTSASETVVEETKTDVQYDSNFYMAPDGSLWSSEAEYRAYAESEVSASSYESETVVTETVVEQTPVVEESGDFYIDENGDVWASYEDYLAYKQSLESSKTR